METKMHRSWTLLVCLSLFLYAMVAPALADDVGEGRASEAEVIEVDQVAIDYLQLISKIMDEETDQWDARWHDGQFNVLPASMMSQGFADTVHCFEPEPENPNANTVAKTRTLHFDLSSMERTALSAAAQLVIRLSGQPTRRYTITIHEGYGDGSQPLDSLVVSPGNDQEWLELSVHGAGPEEWNPEPKDNYALTLELTSSQGQSVSDDEASAFLSSVSPRLVIYTYDNQTVNLEQMKARLKRGASGTGHCGRQSWTTTWDDLDWPGKDKRVLIPRASTVEWTFCDGACNQPLAKGKTEQYTPHARILQSLRIHNNAPVPQSGCAPATLSRHQLLYSSKTSRKTALLEYFMVESCTCQ